MTELIILGVIAIALSAYISGRRDGRRLFQLELRVALHRGESVEDIIEAPGGPSDL